MSQKDIDPFSKLVALRLLQMYFNPDGLEVSSTATSPHATVVAGQNADEESSKSSPCLKKPKKAVQADAHKMTFSD